MNEAKFTKGKWVVYDGEVRFCKGKVCVIEDDGLPTVICDTNDFFGKEEKAANAHLIKTAPKMYGKLENILKSLPIANETEEQETLRFELIDLLAEARGEQ